MVKVVLTKKKTEVRDEYYRKLEQLAEQYGLTFEVQHYDIGAPRFCFVKYSSGIGKFFNFFHLYNSPSVVSFERWEDQVEVTDEAYIELAKQAEKILKERREALTKVQNEENRLQE